MQSILAYIKWLETDVPKKKTPRGSGIFKIKGLKVLVTLFWVKWCTNKSAKVAIKIMDKVYWQRTAKSMLTHRFGEKIVTILVRDYSKFQIWQDTLNILCRLA